MHSDENRCNNPTSLCPQSIINLRFSFAIFNGRMWTEYATVTFAIDDVVVLPEYTCNIPTNGGFQLSTFSFDILLESLDFFISIHTSFQICLPYGVLRGHVYWLLCTPICNSLPLTEGLNYKFSSFFSFDWWRMTSIELFTNYVWFSSRDVLPPYRIASLNRKAGQ